MVVWGLGGDGLLVGHLDSASIGPKWMLYHLLRQDT